MKEQESTEGDEGSNKGNGRSATNGGNGGFISITVSEDDMDLFLLLGLVDCSGGPGGKTNFTIQ